MGILSNTVSISQYRAIMPSAPAEPGLWIVERLREEGFAHTEAVKEEVAGWVCLENMDDGEFNRGRAVIRPPYVCFSLRQDTRHVPAAVQKREELSRRKEWLKAHPDLRGVPKDVREAIKDSVHEALLKLTFATPRATDIVWNLDTGLLSVATATQTVLAQVETLLYKTFKGCRFEPVHPFARCAGLATGLIKDRLLRHNQSSSDAAVDMITGNRWIGQDFLLWLTHRSATASHQYAVRTQGPAPDAQPFAAYVDQKLVLCLEENEQARTLRVSGPLYRFSEAAAGLREGLLPWEAAIVMARDEMEWRLSVKGELFRFASLKSPKVQVERGEDTDPDSEREQVFYERMYLVESALQMFDSLLLEFLELRMGDHWQRHRDAITAWHGGAGE